MNKDTEEWITELAEWTYSLQTLEAAMAVLRMLRSATILRYTTLRFSYMNRQWPVLAQDVRREPPNPTRAIRRMADCYARAAVICPIADTVCSGRERVQLTHIGSSPLRPNSHPRARQCPPGIRWYTLDKKMHPTPCPAVPDIATLPLPTPPSS